MRRFLFLVILISALSTNAQDKLGFAVVEQKTYDYYKNAQWDSLIQLGKLAKSQDVDYYYLNYRMGVAYYNKNNFRMSAFCFENALAQNKDAINDMFFTDLLHLAYVYSQRNDLAMDIPMYVMFSALDPMSINQFTLFGGGGKMINHDHSDNINQPDASYNVLDYQEAVNYWGLSNYFQFNSGFSLGISYSRLNFLIETRIFDEGNFITEDYKISQYNIAVLPEFTIGTKWQIKPVLSLSSNKGYPFSVVDTINGKKVFGFWNYKEYNSLFGVNAYRHIKNIKLGFNAGISNYSKRHQIQAGLNLTYYPFGNLNLYSYSEATLKVDSRKKNYIFRQMVGFKTFSKLWVEGGVLYGELKNYNDIGLGYGYNIADNMDMILYTKLIFTVSNSVSFFVEGQYVQKYTFRKDDFIDKEQIETRIDYDQWNIEGGLIWKF